MQMESINEHESAHNLTLESVSCVFILVALQKFTFYIQTKNGIKGSLVFDFEEKYLQVSNYVTT